MGLVPSLMAIPCHLESAPAVVGTDTPQHVWSDSGETRAGLQAIGNTHATGISVWNSGAPSIEACQELHRQQVTIG